MKVVKNETTTTQNTTNETNTTSSTIDRVKVAELKEKFDTLNSQLTTKEYSILLNSEQTKFLFDTVYENIKWKGYESYAISETYYELKKSVKDGSLNGTTKTEIVEAIFHFLKSYESTGVETARLFRQVCDQFAIPMTEINQDRQKLRDLSLELVSAEQGIPVEQFLQNLNNERNKQG